MYLSRSRLGALIVALVTTFGVLTVVVTDDDGDGRPNSVTITVGSTERIVADRDNQDEADGIEAAETAEIHEDARDETPESITREQADDALVTPPGVGAPKPPAGAQNYRCERAYVQNYSNRAAGTKVSMFVLHFTVSPPGSLPSIRRLFNTPSFGASSTFGLELDGECEQWVPFDKKPWTQGAFNSVSESVEIVTSDLSRAQWLAAPIVKRGILANIVADRLRARGLPARLVDPEGCTPKSGYTDHDRLECGNSHWDVGRSFPWDEFARQVRRYYLPPETKKQKWTRRHASTHAALAAECPRSKGDTDRCRALRSKNRVYHQLLSR